MEKKPGSETQTESTEQLRAALADAQRTIDRQERELGAAQRLREALETASAAATIGSPVGHSRLLEMIVETAAHVISANAGALLLKDEEADELVFEVAVGGKAEEVKRFRVPLGEGVAGLVALTGQPMTIANTEQVRSSREIAESVGYRPQNLLCVPLFYGDDVIGVLELMDKQGAEGFDAADMQALSLFANQAAIAIEQSKVHQSVSAIVSEALATFTASGDGGAVRQAASTFAAEVEIDETHRQTLELARLVHEVVRHGDREREALQVIANAFAGYLRSGSPPSQTPAP